MMLTRDRTTSEMVLIFRERVRSWSSRALVYVDSHMVLPLARPHHGWISVIWPCNDSRKSLY
jgi:hypothetical protein